PVIFFFGVSAYYIDWNKVRASVAGNPLFIFRGSFGFNQTASDGAFQWLDLNSTDPFDPELAAQDSFYAAALKTSEVAFGSAYKGFNDTVAAWSVNRFIHQRCGQTWLATMAEIAKFYSSGNQLQAIQLVTWNDYEEGTEIETGIDGCTYLTPSISGGTLSWTIAGGPENTVHHYTVFASTDGQNLAKLADVPAGTHSLNLSTFMLSPANYVLYVKAVGKPSFQNKISPAIVFRPGDQPPSFSLTVSSVGAQTATATINGASDANGIGSTTIDFGDGTIVSGPSATHTYARSDSYIVTATVADRLGATSVVRKKVTVKSPNAGVTVLGPATGSTVNSPVLFTATANSGGANITTMRIYVDGKAVYTIDQDHILTSLKLYKGTHNVVVQAWDATGAVFKKALTLNAEPNDLPPKAAVTVRALPAVSPLTVLACAATSSDPDGFISGTAMQFSDGVLVNTRGAVHTFSAPGNYSVNVAVMDQFGAVGSTTLPFSVPLSSQAGVTVSSPANGAVVASPVHFVASATSPTAPITAMAIYVDYKLALQVNAASLDRSLPIAAGGHSVIVQAWDATGAVFKTSLTITVSGGGGASGVTVNSPTNGATVSSPVHFVASASSANAVVTAMAIYIDYKLALQVKAASLDQSLAVATGGHSVIVQAWDATGAVFKTPLNIAVTAATATAAQMSP
ncbi:MAG TPA: PKD domain-containing protein, partial [Terriglobales bacterium]|nr:PKD domain-containing protein [Terriglobales bacterium]